KMRVEPSVLRELISLTPDIEPSDCSSGVATLDAMVSGLAPAIRAVTEIMGKSTCGKGATGRRIKARPPASTSATHSKVVVTGRRMNSVNSLMTAARPRCFARTRRDWRAHAGAPAHRGAQDDRTSDK